MIDAIEQQTSRLKMLLIELGFELAPPIQFQKNKIKQVNQEFKDIAIILSGTCKNNLFDNVQTVVGLVTAKHCTVLSLQDVMVQTQHINSYILDYMQ
jgi:hypothetical protein